MQMIVILYYNNMVISVSLEFGGYNEVLDGSGVLNITIEYAYLYRVIIFIVGIYTFHT